MEAKIISQYKLPNTYEEWCKEFMKNVIKPFNKEITGKYNTLETRNYILKKAESFDRTIREMKRHYNINQPIINHVNIEVSFTL